MPLPLAAAAGTTCRGGDGSIPAAVLELPVQATPEPPTINVLDNGLQAALRKSRYDFGRRAPVPPALRREPGLVLLHCVFADRAGAWAVQGRAGAGPHGHQEQQALHQASGPGAAAPRRPAAEWDGTSCKWTGSGHRVRAGCWRWPATGERGRGKARRGGRIRR